MLAVMIAAAVIGRAEPIDMVVDLNHAGVPVSPKLYGVFFEEINHAGDGGLYAELVRNRGFEEQSDGKATGWTVRAAGGGEATLDMEQPLNAATLNSMRLHPGAGSVAIVNDGYWGVPVKRGSEYELSLYARSESGASLSVALESRDGDPLGSVKLGPVAGGWARYTALLKAAGTDPKGRLVLTAIGGDVNVDMVSLFPKETYKGRTNGLRKDLAGMVEAMRPAFVRFPGGCYVEGNVLANRFRWDESLGDVAERPGHLNDVWGYRSTDGLGYHEYLQWCEDMGAEPLFVFNCGMAHRNVVPMEQMGPVVKNALDAIEYAVGSVDTPWGAKRAANGHPAPFDLRMVEVGNENGGKEYDERYALFYDAIKARYPNMRLVANTAVTSRPMDILDEHYYSSPSFFWQQSSRYDRYGRKGPSIYVGEYAVTQGCGTGNLAAALGEAAFMVGMERNSDVVTMSSYAPLFVNAANRAWNPDAIVFDTTRAFGTPSYHVQKLFAENRPDVTLPVTLEVPPVVTVEKGGIGLGTWRTQAEYKDIEVTQGGKVVYRSDFGSGTKGWRSVAGKWGVVDGAYRQDELADERLALLDVPTLRNASDYTVRLKARKVSGDEGFLILVRARDERHYVWWNIGGWANTLDALEKAEGGGRNELGARVPAKVETGRWYDVRIEAEGPRIRCYLDGKLAHDVVERGAPNLVATAGKDERVGDLVVKVVNGAESARTVRVNLKGASEVASAGTAVTIASRDLEDENSFEHPNRVTARRRAAKGLGKSFVYRFAARSVTVLRLRAR